MCSWLLSSWLIIFTQVLTGVALRQEVSDELTMLEDECAAWFSGMTGGKADNLAYKQGWFNFFFPFFKNKMDVFIKIQQCWRQEMLNTYASEASQSGNFLTEAEFVNWCLAHGDQFKAYHKKVKKVVETTIESNKAIDEVEQAFVDAFTEPNRTLSFAELLIRLNRATQNTREIKDALLLRFKESWACLAHEEKINEDAGVGVDGAMNLLALFRFASGPLFKKISFFSSNEYGRCAAWVKCRFEEICEDYDATSDNVREGEQATKKGSVKNLVGKFK